MTRAFQPDLVFLDVEMPDGTGFELLERLGKPAFYVVFITAFNKYAEAAFRFGALDFLTKPIESSLLAETMNRVRERQHEKYTIAQLQVALEVFHQAKQQKLPERIVIHTSKGLELIPVDQILYLDAEANYTDFHYLSLAKKRTLTASLNLKVYEEHFAPYVSFMKVHRSNIVNLRMVDQYLKGDHCLVLRDGSQVGVAKTYREDLEERLEVL
ncbi:MAG: response regulator transcription factor [Saprospiraceae bacterium]|nr:response regulator transcription factor [Saprospiraceae bacterium]